MMKFAVEKLGKEKIIKAWKEMFQECSDPYGKIEFALRIILIESY
jgi:hypothetical protein